MGVGGLGSIVGRTDGTPVGRRVTGVAVGVPVGGRLGAAVMLIGLVEFAGHI